MNTKVIVFDAYGTLFDVNSAAEKCKDKIGDKWEGFANFWRTTQLEYTWPSIFKLSCSPKICKPFPFISDFIFTFFCSRIYIEQSSVSIKHYNFRIHTLFYVMRTIA